ncbi:PLC-like phosphodiesterase [Xylariaceae sp. FL0594]|nr:PLC-like phosphodiesterase [Xylariaceae sp. FL0594]
MCFSMRKPSARPSPRRRLTFNAHGTEAISSLKRALNLGLFIAPTVIHLHGDGRTGGKDIYLSAAIQRSLRTLYNDLRRGDPTLTRERFERFLEVEQGEPHDKVREGLTRDTFKFEQFLETWWMQFGLGLEKPVSIADKDLTKPISNYFIDSSHNTYLSGNQLSGKATTETYRRALREGCRCVEIDVWDNVVSPSPEKSLAGSIRGSRPAHARQISTSSLHTAAAHLKGLVDDKIEQTRQFLGVEKSHSRSPRCSKFEASGWARPEPSTARGPSSTIETPLEQPLAESRQTLPLDEPIVMHGYTLNQPIGFRQVCRAIRKDAFTTSRLPLIISLEVHACREQQEIMVQIMKEEWEGVLVDKPHEACPNGRMPRLEELLDKILVKVKRATMSPESSTMASSLAPRIVVDDEAASGSEDDRSARKLPKVPICEKLSQLAVYTHSEHFDTFEAPNAKIPSHIFSINEDKLLNLWESKRADLFAHNRQFFMRAYPKPTRWDSSNFDPSQFWRKGVQMAAMNRQKWDEGMMLNRAMFSGEQGWVLKPVGFRSDGVEMSEQTSAHPSYRTFDLLITVIAGQHIPLPEGMPRDKASSLRPLVACELHLEKADERLTTSKEGTPKTRITEWKKQTGSGSSDHPEFKPQNRDLCFTGIHRVVEPLSFVRFRVEHEPSRVVSLKENFSSWACIRLDRLATGYRLVTLLDPNGNETNGLLLIKVIMNYR